MLTNIHLDFHVNQYPFGILMFNIFYMDAIIFI